MQSDENLISTDLAHVPKAISPRLYSDLPMKAHSYMCQNTRSDASSILYLKDTKDVVQ